MTYVQFFLVSTVKSLDQLKTSNYNRKKYYYTLGPIELDGFTNSNYNVK